MTGLLREICVYSCMQVVELEPRGEAQLLLLVREDDSMGPRSVRELAALVITSERAAYRAMLGAGERVLKDKKTPSTRHSDEAWVRTHYDNQSPALLGLLNKSLQNALDSLFIMDEYAESVLLLLKQEKLLAYPAISMSRSIHEGALVLCRTFDSGLTTDERLVRMAALDLKTPHGALAAFRSFSEAPGEDETRLVEHIQQLATYLESAGFEIHRKRANPDLLTGVSWNGIREDLEGEGTTAASRTYTPDIHFNWVIGSGAAHSKIWYHQGLEDSTDTSICALVLPLLDLSRILTKTLSTYFGIDATEAIDKTSMRMKALLLRVQ
jgi:hypothetical protein